MSKKSNNFLNLGGRLSLKQSAEIIVNKINLKVRMELTF